jgi:hypothetical protein
MTEEDKIVGGIAAFALILVVGAVFGRLHGAKNGGEGAAIGDRVMFGLLSLPVIALAARLAFPQLHWWALAAPVPILLYTVLLALTENRPLPAPTGRPNSTVDRAGYFVVKNFTPTLFIAVVVAYIVMIFFAAFGLLHCEQIDCFERKVQIPLALRANRLL